MKVEPVNEQLKISTQYFSFSVVITVFCKIRKPITSYEVIGFK